MLSVIALLATQSSGAAGVSAPSAHSRAQGTDASRVSAPVSSGREVNLDASDASGRTVGVRASRPDSCPAARKAVKFYATKVNLWRSKMREASPKRAGKKEAHTRGSSSGRNSELACPRYLAAVLQRKARALRREYARWHRYHYDWFWWLPDKWQRIGACETGYGRRPGSFTWDSGRYVSAFGIYRDGYSQFAHEIGQLSWDETRSRLGRYPSPREQWEVALAIWRRYGFSGWGCRNA